MKNKTLLLCLMTALGSSMASASALRGFQAYSTHISGNTYEITGEVYVRTTAPGPTSVQIHFGDSSTESISVTPGSTIPSMNLSVGTFSVTHTFAANGNYTCSFTITNWDAGILNIADAVNQPMTASIDILVSPFTGSNQFGGFSAALSSGSITGDDYSLDLSYSETDGDSVVTEQQTVSALAVPTAYQFPSSFGGAESIAGNVYHFDNIVAQGAYAVSFRTKEFRSGIMIASHVREIVFDYPAGMASIGELNTAQLVSVYPNPCSEQVLISTNVPEPFAIYNHQGQEVLSAITNQTVNVSRLSTGMYLVKTSSGRAMKLVKE